MSVIFRPWIYPSCVLHRARPLPGAERRRSGSPSFSIGRLYFAASSLLVTSPALCTTSSAAWTLLVAVVKWQWPPLPAVFVAATHPVPAGSAAGLTGHVVRPVMSLPVE